MMYFTSFNLFAFAHYTLSILSSNFFCFKLSKIVFIVAEVPVLVHGTEGTDSTLLVTSLTTLALDSDVRTIRGFQSLIEREWIAAGHPFWLRCNHGAFAVGGVTGPDESPTFLLFLDCVWQVYSSDIWMALCSDVSTISMLVRVYRRISHLSIRTHIRIGIWVISWQLWTWQDWIWH